MIRKEGASCMKKRLSLLLAVVLLLVLVLSACGETGRDTAKITVTYDPVWDSREMPSDQWKKTCEGKEAAELLALLEGFSYDGPPCECAPAYVVETETGQSYGYKPGEAYVRRGEGQTELTGREEEELQALFDKIEEKGEDVSQK